MRNSTPSSCRGRGDDVASTARGGRNLISTQALRAAYTATAPTHEDGVINLNSRVKGGASWYYGDFYVRLGIAPEPFPPRPGDTLLHMALRHKRSASFVATILHLGADKEIANNCGEKAYELDPAAFKLAEALVEQWAKEQGEKMYGGASKGSGSTKSKKNKKKKWYADGYDGYFRARTEAEAREQATAAGLPPDTPLTRRRRKHDDGSTLTSGSSYVTADSSVTGDSGSVASGSVDSRSVSLPPLAEGAAGAR